MASEISVNTSKLSKLERRWWNEYLKHFNATKALRYCNPDKQYTTDSEKSLAHQLKKSVFTKLDITQDSLYQLMGLDEVSLINKGIEGMNATRPIVTPEGVKAIPDYQTRHKYWQDFMKARNMIKDVSRVELTGKDGDPIKMQILAGIGFVNTPPDDNN